MCGIVGIVSNNANGFSTKEAGIFSDLVFLDTVRGFDSTGVFGVHNNSNLVMHKGAYHGLDFLTTKEYREFKAEMIATGKFMVGHNRAATRGTINDANAHPFVVDDKIVLVQNGTYKGNHKHHKNTEVDTEAVAHVIAENADVEEALQKVNAAYALVWYNAEEKSLNLIRNSERPLYLVKYFDTGFAFASEATMLLYAFARNEIAIKDKPEMLPEHTLVTLTLDGKGGYTRTDKKLDSAYKYPKSDATDIQEWWEGHYPANQEGTYRHQPRHNPNALGWQNPTPTNVTPITAHRPGGNADIKFTFADALAQNNKKYFFKSRDEATKHVDFVQQATVNGWHYIEMQEYMPANSNKHCTAWHVYGTLVHMDEKTEGPTTLMHWLEYDKTEEELLAIVCDTFYRTKLSTPIIRSMGTDQWMSSVYVSEKELIQNVSVPQ